MYYPLLSIALGSVLGAWLRWFLGLKLNPIFPNIPLGTVTVNFVGGFIIYGIIKMIIGIRLSESDEIQGADLSIHKIRSTPDYD